MRFVTEMVLREQYRRKPFTTYPVGPDVRLTPEARQFLTDRGIRTELQPEPAKPPDRSPDQTGWEGAYPRDRKLLCRMKEIAALFLTTGGALLETDVIAAQKVFALGAQFRGLQKNAGQNAEIPDLPCRECTGIKCDRFSENLGECFEVTEFHIQLENGKVIMALHRLRSALWELEPAAFEAWEPADGRERDVFLRKLYQIVNTLSQMICHAAGGKECQR